MNKTEAGKNTELNYVVYIGVVVLTEMLGVKYRNSTERNHRGKE